jgi:hypothetical protein
MVMKLRAALLSLLLLPAKVLAANTFALKGIEVSLPEFWNGLISMAAKWIVGFCTTLFLIGAFMMIINANKQERAKQGKTIMTNSIIGLIIVLLAYAIVKTVFSIIF